jgi:hypothetical protein
MCPSRVSETFAKRRLLPILSVRLKFNPRNIQYIPVVKIISFLDLDQNWTFFKGLSLYGDYRTTKTI